MPAASTRLRFVETDLGCKECVQRVFASSSPQVDLVIHFAAVAFVGESVAQPLRYYHNVTGAHRAMQLPREKGGSAVTDTRPNAPATQPTPWSCWR